MRRITACPNPPLLPSHTAPPIPTRRPSRLFYPTACPRPTPPLPALRSSCPSPQRALLIPLCMPLAPFQPAYRLYRNAPAHLHLPHVLSLPSLRTACSRLLLIMPWPFLQAAHPTLIRRTSRPVLSRPATRPVLPLSVC